MKLLSALAFVFVSASAFAQPVITGVTGQAPAHGAVVMVNGSGFGSKATAAPVKFDDFQSVAAGSPIASSSAPGAPWIGGGSIPPVASTERPRPGTPNAKNMLSLFHPLGGSDPSASNVFVRATFRKFYLDTWLYWDSSGETSISQNIKPLRLHAANAGNPNSASLVSVNNDIVVCAVDGSSPTDNISDYWKPDDTVTSNMLRTRGWIHVQIWQDFGTGGQMNGQCLIRLTGGINASMGYTTGLNFGRSGINEWLEFYLGNYVRSEDWGGTSKFFWDSPYVDNSWAHVEASDNANYASATHREVQPATAWADGSVTIKLNRGSFPANASIFLHVCTEANVCSAGRAITLGGTTPPPLAACGDGLDNDGDGLVDLNDPGCSSATDTDESNVVIPPTAACADGVDNDKDGLIDLNDPGCSSATDNDESNVAQPPPTGCVFSGTTYPAGTELYDRISASFNSSTGQLVPDPARVAALKAAKWVLRAFDATTSQVFYVLTCTP